MRARAIRRRDDLRRDGVKLRGGSAVQPVLRPPVTPAADFQLSLASFSSGCAGTNLRLASSVCTPARPATNPPARIGIVSSARPARTSDLHRRSAHPADRCRSIDLRRRLYSGWADNLLRFASNFVLQLCWRRHPACAECCSCSPGWLPPPDRSGCFYPPASPAVDHSACALQSTLRLSLRCTPCFKPNLASPA
jgi:hypothetical protein